MGWAEQRHSGPVAATFLCGDFNNASGSQGYLLAAERYDDQFLKATTSALVVNDDHRIDHVFMKKGSRLQVVSGRMLFTESDYGRVSDHPGLFTEFEPL
jgi:maltose 6'-phosphate phosphatase